ncbi:MAG: hypothetical protein LBP92_08575 [Deltaproteobacteria bacterium]|jgi:hypothetical protein|nr:hypothetical protein [Deltaproteobacteria bacterium]
MISLEYPTAIVVPFVVFVGNYASETNYNEGLNSDTVIFNCNSFFIKEFNENDHKYKKLDLYHPICAYKQMILTEMDAKSRLENYLKYCILVDNNNNFDEKNKNLHKFLYYLIFKIYKQDIPKDIRKEHYMRTVSLYTIYREVGRELSQDLFYQKLKDEVKKSKDEAKKSKDEVKKSKDEAKKSKGEVKKSKGEVKKSKDEAKFKSYTIVKNLLDLDIDISKISKATGYSVRKINAIKNNGYIK